MPSTAARPRESPPSTPEEAVPLPAWQRAQAALRATVHETRRAPGAHDLARAAAAFAQGGRHDFAAAARARALDGSAANAADELRPHTWTLLLQSCRADGAVNGAKAALATWDAMRERGVAPTTFGLQQLLSACEQAGEWRAALDALRTARAPPPDGDGLAADVTHYNTVLATCARAGEVEEATSLLRRLVDGVEDCGDGRRIVADATSFNSVLFACVRSWAGGESAVARAARAEELLALMDASGVARNERTYRVLMDLHQYDPAAVLAVLADAKRARADAGGALGVLTYQKAARTLLFSGLADHARQLIASMEHAGVAPDAAFYATVVAAAQGSGLLDEADKLYREAADRGLGAEVEARMRQARERTGGRRAQSRSDRSGRTAAATTAGGGNGASGAPAAAAEPPERSAPLTATAYTGCACEICQTTL